MAKTAYDKGRKGGKNFPRKNMKKEAMGLPNPNPMTGKVFSGGKMKGKANPKIPKSTPKTAEKIP